MSEPKYKPGTILHQSRKKPETVPFFTKTEKSAEDAKAEKTTATAKEKDATK